MHRLINGVLGIAVALILLSGCGVPVAGALHQNVSPVPLRSFAKQDWRLANNKFFLWKENMTADQAATALSIAQEVDHLDGQALPLNRRHFELDQQLAPYKDKLKWLNNTLRPIKGLVDGLNKKKATALQEQSRLEDDLKKQTQQPTPDPVVMASLREKIAGVKAQLQAIEEDRAGLAPVKSKLEQDIEANKALIAPLQTETDQVEAAQDALGAEGARKITDIMKVVDWYKDQPTAVVFQFKPDGRIAASISGWDLGDGGGVRMFSTEDSGRLGGRTGATLANVVYTELGGTFEFDAFVYDGDTVKEAYHFKISRSNYDATDGRVFFVGDITRTRQVDGKLEVRRGLAKLVDRNN